MAHDIKSRTDLLKEGEEYLPTIMANSSGGIVVLDENREIRYVNPAAERILGSSIHGLTGRPFEYEIGGKEAVEVEIPHNDHTRKTAAMHAVKTSYGNESIYIVSLHDVTERKLAEQRLKESERTLRNLMESVPAGIAILTPEGDVLEANESIWKIFGYESREEFLKHHAMVHYKDPEDWKRFIKLHERGVVRDFEAQFKKRDGTIIWGYVTSAEHTDDAGKRTFMSIFQDITKRKKEEEEETLKYDRMIRQQAALVKLATTIQAVTDNPERIFRFITEVAAETIEAGRASIWLLSEDRKALNCLDVYEKSPGRHSTHTSLQTGSYPWYLHVLGSGNVIKADYAPEDPRIAELKDTYLLPLKITSILHAPIFQSGRLAGVFCFEEAGTRRRWTTDEERFAAEIADKVVQALIEIDRRTADEMFRSVVEGTSSVTGTEFFNSLVYHLASALNVHHAFVGELTGQGSDKIATISVWSGGGFAKNITYGLAGTPCDNIVGREICYYPSGVRDLFPEDHLLEEMGIDSYLGIPIFNSSGKPLGLLVAMDNKPIKNDRLARSVMTIFATRAGAELERKQIEFEIRKLSAALEHSVNVVFITDREGIIQYINPMFEKVTGYSENEALGETPNILASGETREKEYKALWKTIKAGRTWRGVFKNRKKNGNLYWSSSVISPIRDVNGNITHFLAVQEDITEKRVSEEKIHILTHFDEITGLYNRTCFIETLKGLITYSPQQDKTGALLLIDLDQFKVFNDTYGHIMGDDILRHIGRRLQDTLMERYSEDHIIGRLSSDEFAVFLPHCNEECAMEVAEQIRCGIEELRPLDITDVHLSASIGVVTHPRHGNTTKALLTRADAAMYRAKKLGRNRVHLYRPEDRDLEHLHSRLVWREKIAKALEEGRFIPWFQSIMSLEDNAIHHCEALARMKDEENNILAPNVFIDTAEKFGLIGAIDRQITEKVMLAQVELSRQGNSLTFSMNLSGKDLGDEELLSFIQSKIAETGVDPNHLIFEITETAAVHDLDSAIRFINALREMGCHFALDDFGVGFTSFIYLKEMQVDYIKIDGSFIRNLHKSPNDQLFVKAITDVASGMGIKTIAEFVEYEETLNILREFGVDYAQGYLIGKPAPTLGAKQPS